MDDYLSKPLRRQTIRDVLGRLPEFRPAGPPLAATGDVFDPAPLQEIGDPETEVTLANDVPGPVRRAADGHARRHHRR